MKTAVERIRRMVLKSTGWHNSRHGLPDGAKTPPGPSKDRGIAHDDRALSALIFQSHRPALGDNDHKTFTNSLGMAFVRIDPGTFLMGSPADEKGRDDDEVQHEVTLTRAFYMGEVDVTRGQFGRFVKAAGYRTDAEKGGHTVAWVGDDFDDVKGATWQKPGSEQGDDHPVVLVSWNDAQAFCGWLSRTEGKTYRLPTEAEWEYACRAGTKTAYYWGDDPDAGKGFANAADATFRQKEPLPADASSWKAMETFKWADRYVFTSPVGKFEPNAFGLYDMIGNVYVWCSDAYAREPSEAVTDPAGPERKPDTWFVIRGGSWCNGPTECRCAARVHNPPTDQATTIGFRIVLDAP